jgi:putative endonuclease
MGVARRPTVHRPALAAVAGRPATSESSLEVVAVTRTDGRARHGDHGAGMPHRVASAVGAYGERLAARYLADAGLEVVDRNWRCAQGEIDIVALDGSCLVVCEVKTRRSLHFGSPVEGVTWRKAARLRRLAACWLAEHEVPAQDVRVDVIGVLRPRRGPAQIEHLVAVGA